MKLLSYLGVCILLGACSCGPAQWAEETSGRLQCGMTIDQVHAIAGRKIVALDVPRDWTTHMIRDGSTDLWLGFSDGKLRWAQVLWAQKIERMAMYQRVDLCGK